jgi:hypothetical protein
MDQTSCIHARWCIGSGLALQATPNPLCAALAGIGRHGASPTTVAIVGNGPLSVDQRAAIATADRVVRFHIYLQAYPAAIAGSENSRVQ